MSAAPPMLPALLPTAEVDQRLIQLAEHRMLSPARQAEYELRLVGSTVLPQRQVIARTKYGTWLFVDHVEDPTAHHYRGKIPIPEEQYAKLAVLDQAGVRPDVVWLGHEVHDDWREGEPVPVPAPRHLREKDQRLKVRLAKGTELFLKGAGATLALAAAPLAVGAAAIGAGAGAGLDPIVFGGVRHPQAPVVMWVALAQWEWE